MPLSKTKEWKQYESSVGIGVSGSNLASAFAKCPIYKGSVNKGSIEALVKMEHVRSYKPPKKK